MINYCNKITFIINVDTIFRPSLHSAAWQGNDYIKKYMLKYGIDNVRGGLYNQIDLDKDSLSLIKKGLNIQEKNDDDDLEWFQPNKGFAKETKIYHENICYMCGCAGHFSNKCPYINGDLEIKFSCNKCGKKFENKNEKIFHENVYCKKKKDFPFIFF
jgi:hypothetical protein